MAYEDVGDPKLVTLGGYNKTTRIDNPTKLEGYYIRSENVPDKFNPGKTKNKYVFKTEQGEVGTIAPSRLDKRMKNAIIGRMTLIKFTGEEDTGKGNPVKLFTVEQDKTIVLDADSLSEYTSSVPYEDSSVEPEEEEVVSQQPSSRVSAPTQAAQSRVAELLKKRT